MKPTPATLGCRLAVCQYLALRAGRRAALVVLLSAAAGLTAAPAPAGVIHTWPEAVVTGAQVRLDDVAELRGFDAATAAQLAAVIVAESPAPGGSRQVNLDLVRSAVADAGVNLATVSLRGSINCAVRRPALPAGPEPEPPGPTPPVRTRAGAVVPAAHGSQLPAQPATPAEAEPDLSLRGAVVEHLGQRLARYGGEVEVVFDPDDRQALELTGPTYQFRVRSTDRAQLGRAELAVEIWSAGQRMQVLELTVRVTLRRQVVVARRPINQGAAITDRDVDTAAAVFTQLSQLGISDPSQVIGLRAKRFIRAGYTLDPLWLESVPLVNRNQPVTLITQVGGIRIKTAAKALETGRRGDVIRVCAVDDRHQEFEVVVTGPGQVQLGAGSSAPGATLIGRAGER